MKKKIISVSLIIVFLVFMLQGFVQATNVDNNYYSFYIPNKYENVTSTSSYKSYLCWHGDYLTSVSFSAYKYSASYLKPYTQTDVDNRVNSIKNSYKNDKDCQITSIKGYLTEHNGVKGYRVTYFVKYNNTGMEFGHDLIELRSDNYQYGIDVDSSKSFVNSNEAKQIVNSFKIKDTVLRSKGIPFTDVSSKAWSYSAVKYAYENNIISGYNSYTFAPSDKVTRGMFVTMLYKLAGKPALKSNTSKFSDVKNSKAWYYNAVLWASQNNIVSGYSNGKFGPNDNITREQLAVILNKYAKYKKKNTSQTNNLNSFSDKSKVSSWALNQVKWAVGAGVITGSNGKLNPKGSATREETASMIYKYCTKVGK